MSDSDNRPKTNRDIYSTDLALAETEGIRRLNSLLIRVEREILRRQEYLKAALTMPEEPKDWSLCFNTEISLTFCLGESHPMAQPDCDNEVAE